MNQLLNDKLKTLPNSAGVYFHKSAQGEVIYVGKAANLKNRVKQYFNNSPKDAKTAKLIDHIAITDWIETESEIDALFLENEMIKRYKPRFNILLRDDKNNSFVRIDFKSAWPTVTLTRIPLDDKAEYIGPFYGAVHIRRALRYLRRSFPYLTKSSERNSKLLQQLNLVPVGTSQEYISDLKLLSRYLHGERVKIQSSLKKQMKEASQKQDFETAAKLRDKITSLNELKKQIIYSREEFIDISKDQALVGAKQLFGLPAIPRRIECYDISHQSGINVVGSMVVVTNGVADKKQYRKFKLSQSKNDDFAALAEVMYRRFNKKHANWEMPDLIVVDGGYPQIQAIANLVKNTPLISLAKKNDLIIVAKDNSHLSTDHIEQLMCSKIEGVEIVDCGQYYSIDLHVGAKHSAGHSTTFIGNSPVNPYTDLLKLLQRLRDESHRFAIAYHQSLKTKRQTTSRLDSIPGVGPKTRHKLLKKFGSVQAVAKADVSQLSQVVSPNLAIAINKHLSSS